MQTKIVIILSIVLGLFALTIMALVTRFFANKHTKHDVHKDAHVYTKDGCLESQNHITNFSNTCKRLLSPRERQPKKRSSHSLSEILQGGDEGLFSCTLFHDLPEYAQSITLESFHDAIGRELQNKAGSPLKWNSNSLGRHKSVSQRRFSGIRTDFSTSPKRKSMDISMTNEWGLSRNFSTRKPIPALVTMHNGLKNSSTPKDAINQYMLSHDKESSVRISPSEFAALVIISGQGAFGITLLPEQLKNGIVQASFKRIKRNIIQQHAQQSILSPLFAKHLAAGSLPYQHGDQGVDSILLDSTTIDQIQAGTTFPLKSSTSRTSQAKYLSSLPNARQCRFYVLATSTETHTASTLTDAIAALPFSSGLVPFASTTLIKSVQFIASGGLPYGRLLQRLEGLVDKVHAVSPHLNIFGPLYEPRHAGLLYRERERLGKLAKHPNMQETLADKAARMSRYVTLLERLMALVPDMKPQEVYDAVQDVTRREVRQAHTAAVTAHNNHPTSKSASVVTWRDSVQSDLHSKRQSVTSTRHSMRTSSSSPRRSSEQDVNLGKQVEQVLKQDLPLSIPTIGFIARMVIVAWTLSVGHVAWEDGEEGIRLPRMEDLPEEIVLC